MGRHTAANRPADPIKSLRQMLTAIIAAQPLARIDYVSAADPLTRTELQHVTSGVLLSTAVFFGHTRLIDNIFMTGL